MQRRDFLGAAGAVAAVGLAGCNSVIGSEDPTPTDSEEPVHTVSVYLSDRELTHEVIVTVSDEAGSTLFKKEYSLSDSNESDEDATFPALDDPDTVMVAVDGTQFERDWPGFEHPELPCDEPTHAGIEIWIEESEDGSPAIRLEVNCQSVRIDGQPAWGPHPR
ncbi:MAG: twin-arginine translocation signal domain-containing protein [Halobacteriales archaeon]